MIMVCLCIKAAILIRSLQIRRENNLYLVVNITKYSAFAHHQYTKQQQQQRQRRRVVILIIIDSRPLKKGNRQLTHRMMITATNDPRSRTDIWKNSTSYNNNNILLHPPTHRLYYKESSSSSSILHHRHHQPQCIKGRWAFESEKQQETKSSFPRLLMMIVPSKQLHFTFLLYIFFPISLTFYSLNHIPLWSIDGFTFFLLIQVCYLYRHVMHD